MLITFLLHQHFTGLSEKGDKNLDNGLNQQTNTKLKKNKIFTSNHLVNNSHKASSTSGAITTGHHSLPSSQLLLQANSKISVMSSELNSRVSPVSLTDSLNVIAEDNFIEVSEERSSDQLEQGIGNIGQAWSIKPVNIHKLFCEIFH